MRSTLHNRNHANKPLRRLAAALAVVACSAVLALIPHCGQAAEDGFSARRSVMGHVRQDMAEEAARTAAELAAYEQAARQLASEPDLRFLTAPPEASGALAGRPVMLSLDGLALQLFTIKEENVRAEGFPPHIEAVVHVRLAEPDNLRASLRQAIGRPDQIELFAQVIAARRILLARYDDLAAEVIAQRPDSDTRGYKEVLVHLQSVINEMRAVAIYAGELRSYDRSWLRPNDNNKRLQKAYALAPRNPLILTALAEVLLQLDLPVQAMDHAGTALAIAPEIARAHDVKGVILLRQSLPSLALESFAKAMELSPQNPIYPLHSAAANMLLENEDAMCADLAKACALGICDELQSARERDRCLTARSGAAMRDATGPSSD